MQHLFWGIFLIFLMSEGVANCILVGIQQEIKT